MAIGNMYVYSQEGDQVHDSLRLHIIVLEFIMELDSVKVTFMFSKMYLNARACVILYFNIVYSL